MSEQDDAMDYQISVEQQRARLQTALRDCISAVMISTDKEGGLTVHFVNLNNMELRGMIELLHDTRPRFNVTEVEFAEDADDEDDG